MDLSAGFQVVSGRRALAEALWRRWSTDRGGLLDDPNYGENLSNHLNDDMSPADVRRAQAAAEAEALKDERVVSIRSTATLVDSVLSMEFEVEDGAGPFTLTLGIDDVTVDLLTVTP